MNNGLLHGLAVLVVVGLMVLIYLRTGKRQATYTLSEPWTNAPILWSATDEVIPGGGHGNSALQVGGGASGGW